MDEEPKLSLDNDVKRRNSNGNNRKRNSSLGNITKGIINKVARRRSLVTNNVPDITALNMNAQYGNLTLNGVTLKSSSTDPDTPSVPPSPTPQAAMDVEELETIDQNLRHLVYINGVDVRNMLHVYIAKVPFLPADLEALQIVMDKYFNNVLNMNMSVYMFLQTCTGDYTVGYYYFTRLLRSLNMDKIKYDKCRKVMYKMYIGWSENVCRLFGLVINANGAAPVKEIMNIINQSVYMFLRFVTKTTDQTSLFFIDNPYELPANSMDPLEEEVIQQQELVDLYNQKLYNVYTHNFSKFTNEERVTDTAFLGELKLVNVTPTYKTVQTFKLIK